MTGLEQSRHMCDMSQGIFEARAKLFERRGLGFEDETWSNGFQQLDKVKVSFAKKREFNWLTAVCLISCRFLRAEKKALWKHSDSVVCYKFHGKSSFVGRSPSRAEWEHRNYCPLCFGVAFRKEHFKSAHFWGRQPAHLLNWLDSLWVLHRTKWKQHTIALKVKPLSLPDVHKTQDVCEVGATVLPFVWSLFGAASRPKPCRWLGFCEQKDLHGLTLRHKCGTQFDWQQALKKK